jgi:hypothetical protein
MVLKVKMVYQGDKENKELKEKVVTQDSMDHLVSLVPQVLLDHQVAKEQLEVMERVAAMDVQEITD